jgi:hypothetical protein
MDLNEDDIPANNIGAGNIQGAGVGPQGEPGVYLKKRKLAVPVKRLKGFKDFTHAKRRSPK